MFSWLQKLPSVSWYLRTAGRFFNGFGGAIGFTATDDGTFVNGLTKRNYYVNVLPWILAPLKKMMAYFCSSSLLGSSGWSPSRFIQGAVLLIMDRTPLFMSTCSITGIRNILAFPEAA